MEGKKMNRADKMVQIALKRQRKKKDVELLRLNKRGREMVKIYPAILDAAHT